jgi:hypothetical protein
LERECCATSRDPARAGDFGTFTLGHPRAE